MKKYREENHPSWRNKHSKYFDDISPRYLYIYTYSDLWMTFDKNEIIHM